MAGRFLPGLFVLTLSMFFLPERVQAQTGGRALDTQIHHLGDSEIKDWPGVAEKPEGTALHLKFEASPNAAPVTLQFQQRDVDGIWHLGVNGREFAELRRIRPNKTASYEIPAGMLRDGENTLDLVPDNMTDDIAVGPFVLHDVPLRQLLNLQSLEINVTDADSGKPLPARISIESSDGSLPDIYTPQSEKIALREGMVYLEGSAAIELPAGKYQVAATRGMEWSRDEKSIDLTHATAKAAFQLRREVDTRGFVAADTHIHTYTFSGHGDATMAERLLSLAGEGVELAVATDHNHNTDYRPEQNKLGLSEYFTPVTGNEVTTPIGHFNGFPLKPDDEVPPFKETNWVKVVDGIRMKGAKVVILNHPRWPKIDDSPFSKEGLNRATGDRTSGAQFTFDAMELINSTVEMKDPLYLFTDWFALLNAGEKISAVGSSDSHTVGDPVGQGRTYIPSSTDDPSKLNVDELCENLLKGRATISMGIFCEAKVNGNFGPGDLVPVEDGKVEVELRVAAPDWIHPTKAMLFVNGEKKAEEAVDSAMGKPTDTTLKFEVRATGVDSHLVCVVIGDPIKFAGWKTLNDYTLAATNPVFLDVNRDGEYASPRDSARRILASVGGDVDALINTLEVVPVPIGVQMLALSHDRQSGADLERLNHALVRLAEFNSLYALYKTNYDAAHSVSGK